MYGTYLYPKQKGNNIHSDKPCLYTAFSKSVPSAGSEPGSLLVQSGTAPPTASSCSNLHREEMRNHFLSYTPESQERESRRSAEGWGHAVSPRAGRGQLWTARLNSLVCARCRGWQLRHNHSTSDQELPASGTSNNTAATLIFNLSKGERGAWGKAVQLWPLPCWEMGAGLPGLSLIPRSPIFPRTGGRGAKIPPALSDMHNAKGCFREGAGGSRQWKMKQGVSDHSTKLNLG